MTELAEIKNIETVEPKKFQKIIEREEVGVLRERRTALKIYLQKIPSLPLGTPEEKLKLREKINNIRKLLDLEITRKEQQKEKEREQLENERSALLFKTYKQDLRYSTDMNLANYTKGTLPLNLLQWEKLENETITLPRTGEKVNLLKLLKFPAWEKIINEPFQPFTLKIGLTGAMRGNNPLPIWRDGLAETVKDIKKIRVVQDQYISIMRV